MNFTFEQCALVIFQSTLFRLVGLYIVWCESVMFALVTMRVMCVLCIMILFFFFVRARKIPFYSHCRCIQSENMHNSKYAIVLTTLVNVKRMRERQREGEGEEVVENIKCFVCCPLESSNAHTFIKMFNVMCMWLQFN